MLLGGAEPGDDERVPRSEVVLLRDEGGGRRVERDGDERPGGIRQRRDRIPSSAQCLGSLIQSPEEQREVHLGPHRVQPEFEGRDDAEVAPAPAQRPEQVRV